MVTKVGNLTSISGLGLPMSKVPCLHLACSQEKLVFKLPGDKIRPAPLSQAQLILLCSLWQRNEQRGLACKTLQQAASLEFGIPLLRTLWLKVVSAQTPWDWVT